MAIRCFGGLVGLVWLIGCSAALGAERDAVAAGEGGATNTGALWEAPALERSIAVYDGRTGETIRFEEMLDDLAEADVVFLGETHVDETTHRVELAVYEGLLERRAGRVVLGMEMFERDVQRVLDRYIAGEIEEAEFLEGARPWGQYGSAYRPLIERARSGGHAVVASNIPRSLTRKIARKGLGVLDELPVDERAHAPAELLANTPEYWRRVDNAIRGHMSRMAMSGDDDQRLDSTQTLWDNAMGESCAIALDKHPGSTVLHINGAFHSEYWDGTVHQFMVRKPDAKVLTLDVRSTRNPGVVELDGKPVADYIVMAESRAQDQYDGMWSVALDKKLDYRLHVPESASESNPVPLMIWFGENGLDSGDGMDLWKDRLGDEVAIAAIEPPYRARNIDKSDGGRWFWTDSFAEDIGSLIVSTEFVWGYLARYSPIDTARVCVGGEGAGGTVAAAIALLGDRMDPSVVAFDPAEYAKLKDFPLPLPEYSGRPDRVASLAVVGSDEDKKWWGDELAAYEEVGVDTEFVLHAGSIGGRDWHQAVALREAMGLTAPEPRGDAASAHLVVPADTARARHWSRLYALRHTAWTGQAVTLVAPGSDGSPAISLADLVSASTIGDALPRCPGPFGGTTVLVLPEGVNEADTEAWIALEENDPLNKKSMFHRVRIAQQGGDAGDRALPEMLATLEDQGRKNVLIVPGVFYAGYETMHALELQAREFSDRMTIQWMPGLGGQELPVAAAMGDAPVGTVDHGLRVSLDPESHTIAVEDTLLLPPGLRKAGTEFTLNSALEIQSCEPAVRRLGNELEEDEPEKTRYALAADAGDGKLTVRYGGAVHFALSDEKEQYSKGFRSTHGSLGPEGVYLAGSSAWIPEFDDELVRFRVEVETPSDWHVISQGSGGSDSRVTASGTRIAAWESGAVLEQVYLVGGPLVVRREMAGAVEVLVYLHEGEEALARKYLDATARYIEMYRKLIGPYPYDKFALVENFWETGYGMPSFTLLGPQVIRLPFILHSSYPHEILHNWWGNSVFVDYDAGNWCEGLTAYMADHLIQEQRGRGPAYRRDTLQKFRSFAKDGRDFPLREFRTRHSAATEAVGYGKSLMLFHMLRQRIGDDAFRDSMRDFYRKNRSDRVSYDEIRSSVESITGEDLSAFFAQWVDTPGAPSLALRDVERDGDSAGAFTVSGTLVQRQSGGAFDLSVPIVIACQDGQQSFVIEASGSETPFAFTVQSNPLAVAVDPAFDVFRLLDPFEMPSSIGQIFGEPEVLAVLPSRGDVETYRDLVEQWRTDDHEIEVVLDAEIQNIAVDRGVWVLGRSNLFAPQILGVDPGFDASSPVTTVKLGDEQVGVDAHSIVVIRRNPVDPEKAIGWISVEPGAAFDGFARKLPHYGKYSYLAFEGDEPTNFAKGQWATTDSPLVVEFEAGGASRMVEEDRSALAELPAVFSQVKLEEHVAWLAAPEREGRGLGTEGIGASAEYIAEQFAAAGLEPGGDDGTWYQHFTVGDGPDGTPVRTKNVVGVLRGSRVEWGEQSVVLGAHYDHLGFGWPGARTTDAGKLHPGADDNASGVSVLLELARSLSSEGGGSRNLVFVAFSGEEAGRHGSKHYVGDPRFPVSGMRGMINMDSVGRLDGGEIQVLATGTAYEWPHIFRGVGFVTGIRSKNIPTRIGGSDEESFIEAGVPAVQLFTGTHEDYHRPTDTADKIDTAGLVGVATFVKEAVMYLVEREEPMDVRIEGIESTQAESQPAKQGGRRVSFGTVPDFGFTGKGVLVESVVAASPAERAGVIAGDILIRVDGNEIGDLRGFSNVLKTLEPGQAVDAVVLRDQREVKLKVKVEAR